MTEAPSRPALPSPPAPGGVRLSWPVFTGMAVLSLLGIAFLSAVLARSAAAGELVVVHDSGRSVSALPYYEPFLDERPPQPEVRTPPRPVAGDDGYAAHLPVHSPGLTPGPLPGRAAEYPNLTQPFFLVGADAFSRRWLVQNRPRLTELGALGLVVEADSVEAFRTLQRLAGTLSLAPVSATGFAQQLGIDRYPVLITPAGLDQ